LGGIVYFKFTVVEAIPSSFFGIMTNQNQQIHWVFKPQSDEKNVPK